MGLTRTLSPCAIAPAGTSTKNDKAMNTSASANFAGTDGSRGPSLIHNQANSGASRITQIGCTIWNQDTGNEIPSSSSRVKRAAKSVNVDPACSYAPQKNVAQMNR